MNRQQTKMIQKLLKRTWMSFFARYGKLLSVQFKTIPLILRGENVIIVSSTASGKTEAVVAPLIERLLSEKWESVAILYISPTRALVNDLHLRLNEVLQECNVITSLKTGDKPYFSKSKLPHFLITTPESLDSMLCRFSDSLRNIKAVVVDEIHLLDNTYRGDQLRFLLRRLQPITSTKFNVYALSATVENPDDVGGRYMQDFSVVSAPGERHIFYTFVRSVDDIKKYAEKERLNKLLIFCNCRASVEDLGQECVKLWGSHRVVVHHGSLSKNVREEAERYIKECQMGVCVSTMTLEIGIDIGSIDAVILAEVPWSLSALIQRIGRGNRRTGKSRVFAICETEDEKVMLEKMFEAASKGITEPVDYKPDLSVIIQQIFSSLFAKPDGLGETYFLDLFKDFCIQTNIIDILEHLSDKSWIKNQYGKWYATEKLMDIGEKGNIHSNIPDAKEMEVININSGQAIGKVLYPVDEIFILAGRVWRVVSIKNNKLYVKSANTNASSVNFKSRFSKGSFHYLLPPHLT